VVSRPSNNNTIKFYDYFSLLLHMKVFGFFAEPFTGIEQAEPYQLQVGYRKVRSGLAQQLTFNVRGNDGTASKLHITIDFKSR
jgi:hypothetical protein